MNNFCNLLIFTALLFFGFGLSAQTVFPHDTRSDSVHVYHYDISLDFRNFNAQQLSGHTRVRFSPLVNGIDRIALDLLGPDVDSVLGENGAQLVFTAGTAGFSVDLPSGLNADDSSWIDVFYHGAPHTDAEFGGFYFSGQYAYNVGVSLSEIPHNFGKTWFPCQDNFVNRSTYDFYITTNPAHEAACGGMLVSTTVNPDLSETHHWKMEQTIPSYLASVAVSDYVYLNRTFSGVNGPMPVKLAARPADTTALNGSFANLENAFDIYEAAFGPYRWDRVGYSVVPMAGGAMEHAMNIAYPKMLINGNTTYQSVMAHELSHHWWGDLVTCTTAEDMWINEGSASYCEYLFTEQLSGREDYEAEIRANHKSLLRTCHIDDEGYWPLSGVPQEHTYGVTTYSKGADMIHTLRAYLGDEQFFDGLTQLLDQNQFSDINAVEYRDELSQITGTDLTNYFADWIFQGGWPHISIDSIQAVPSGANYNVSVYLRQKLTGRTHYSHHVPVTLTLRDNSWNVYETKIWSEGQQNVVNVTVPFVPAVYSLNEDELISHAVTGAYPVLSATGTETLGNANLQLTVESLTDSVLMIAEHNWTAPDAIVNNTEGFMISPQRYWRIEGIWPAGFSAKAAFRYSGQTSGANGYLDDQLIDGTEDSVVLLYRADRAADWTEFAGYTKNTGNLNDKTGTLIVDQLLKGEYAIGMRGESVGLHEQNKVKASLFPNPAGEQLSIRSNAEMKTIVVRSANGQTAAEFIVSGKEAQVNISGLAAGTYYCTAYGDGGRLFTEVFVKR
jgi:hypothetical protein